MTRISVTISSKGTTEDCLFSISSSCSNMVIPPHRAVLAGRTRSPFAASLHPRRAPPIRLSARIDPEHRSWPYTPVLRASALGEIALYSAVSRLLVNSCLRPGVPTMRIFRLAACLLLCLPLILPAGAADLKPEEIVAKHLDSIGTSSARAAKTRVVEGPVTYRILVGGAGDLDGKSVLVSQDQKLHFMMKLNNNLYRGEQFIFDGDRDEISFSTANQTRSQFGEFVRVQDVVLREGLLGGVLSTAWPLYNLDSRKAKLSYEGMKKIDGKDLYQLRYKPKKSTDADILLYFDPTTFRHVETVYTIRVRAQLGNIDPQTANAVAVPEKSRKNPDGTDLGDPVPPLTGGVVGETNETATAHQQETRYRLEERFSDFEAFNGLTLPTHYTIQFSQELGNGKTAISEWA